MPKSTGFFSFIWRSVTYFLKKILLTATCNHILRLFGIEKRKDTLCLADFCLSLAETDYPLPLASLFTLFSESKKRQKIFAAQTPPRKRGYVEDFAYRNNVRLRNLKNPRFALSTMLCCEIAARQARGWGWYLSKICLSQFKLLCHVTLRSA